MQSLDFLLVRKAQLQREIRAMGIVYFSLLAVFIVTALLFFYKSQQLPDGTFYALPVLALIVASVHFTRTDHQFIHATAENPAAIYFWEYFTFTSPLILISLLAHQSLLMLLLPVAIGIISIWKIAPGKSRTINLLQFVVKDTNFEWKAGLRRSGFILVFLWLLALALIWIPFAPLGALWFFLLTLSSFYEEGESREMLESYEAGANVFLRKKIINQVSAFIITTLPVLAAACMFFPERWWVLLLFLVFGSLNLAVFIVSKYSVWQPGDINRSGSIVNALCMLGLFLPFLLPLPIFVFFRNYFRALKNLKPVLHDFDS